MEFTLERTRLFKKEKKNRLKERVDRGRMESRKTWVMEKIWTGS